MENVILCNGNYAVKPYYLEEDNLRIYSVEELCYYLYKNAILIQADFFSDALYTWMSEELGLSEWVQQLLMLKGREDEVLRTMEFLFRITGYCDSEEILQVRSVLNESNHLTVFERRKLRADAYCKKKQYVMAMTEYEQLLQEINGEQMQITGEEQIKFRAKLYHNIGVCEARLFIYEKAADSFMKAYETYPNTESYVQFLATVKLGSSQEEYLTYLSEHPESYEESLELENRISGIEKAWEKMPFEEVLHDRMDDNHDSYYDALKQLLKEAKSEYINMVDKR